MDIRIDDLSHPDVQELLQEHLKAVALHSPPESIHALDLDKLRQPEITFWTAWEGDVLLGCGALKQLDAHHGEIKSMRTASAHVRKGAAAALLAHILEHASRSGYRRLSLETGSATAFAPAHALYARFGFIRCAPFATYDENPHSAFMTREV